MLLTGVLVPEYAHFYGLFGVYLELYGNKLWAHDDNIDRIQQRILVSLLKGF